MKLKEKRRKTTPLHIIKGRQFHSKDINAFVGMKLYADDIPEQIILKNALKLTKQTTKQICNFLDFNAFDVILYKRMCVSVCCAPFLHKFPYSIHAKPFHLTSFEKYNVHCTAKHMTFVLWPNHTLKLLSSCLSAC